MAVKWGVIGCGGIADRRTIPEGFAASQEAELIAVQDVDEARATAVAAKYAVAKVYTEGVKLLEDPEVEAVYVASPTASHHQYVLAAARAGKHVLCEKPLALNVAQAEEMVAACKEAGVKFGVNFMMRFHACHQYLHQLIAEGKLGKPVLGKAELTCWYPPIPGAFRQDPAQGGGGALIDMGNHCLDLLEYLFGQRVARVSCFTANLVQAYPSEDTAAVLAEFDGGAMALVNALFNVPDAAAKNMLVVYGSRGGAWAFGTIGQDSSGQVHVTLEEEEAAYDAAQVRTGSGGEQTVTPEPVNIYRAHVDAMSRAIREGTEPPVPGEVGLWSQRVIAACYESARTGQCVEVQP
ncbi:MAG: Gfo/Idh/MocA family oxidoreductase [Armatimonadetes bacterium]|nr:Gfo/Idh/MocA family oxidoreductase [Armatimonadota bacterium]